MRRVLYVLAPILLLAGCGDDPVRITQPDFHAAGPAGQLGLTDGSLVTVWPRPDRGLAVAVAPVSGPSYAREFRMSFGRDPETGAMVHRRTVTGPDGWARITRSQPAERGGNPTVFRVETAHESREVRLERMGNRGRFTYTWTRGTTVRTRTLDADFLRFEEPAYREQLTRQLDGWYADLAAQSELSGHADLALMDEVLSHPELPGMLLDWQRRAGITATSDVVEVLEYLLEFCELAQNLETLLCMAKFNNSFLIFLCESGLVNEFCGAVATLHLMMISINDPDQPDTDFEPPPGDSTGGQ